MSIDVLQLPKGKRGTQSRPCHCTHCQGETFQRWGKERSACGIHTCAL